MAMRRRRLVGRHIARHGLPSTPPKGAQPTAPVRITVIDYDDRDLVEKTVETAEDCLPFRDKATVTWINVDGLGDVSLIEALSTQFGLHHLVQEDIRNTNQRPKVEDFEDYLYAAIKMLRWDGPRAEADIEHVSIVLGGNFVLTFQEQPGDVFESVRERVRTDKGRVRRMGADYLSYCLLDAIVDGYFVVLEKRGELIEQVEDAVIADPSPQTLQEIHRLKREGVFIRRSIWPAREAIAALERSESPLLSRHIRMYLRDIHGQITHVIDAAESLREMLSGIRDTYLTSVSNRMNEVMKVLTIIATIFIPLTFIAGIYGMNFAHMPELKWTWGYPLVWAIMLAVTVVMLAFFRKKKWL